MPCRCWERTLLENLSLTNLAVITLSENRASEACVRTLFANLFARAPWLRLAWLGSVASLQLPGKTCLSNFSWNHSISVFGALLEMPCLSIWVKEFSWNSLSNLAVTTLVYNLASEARVRTLFVNFVWTAWNAWQLVLAWPLFLSVSMRFAWHLRAVSKRCELHSSWYVLNLWKAWTLHQWLFDAACHATIMAHFLANISLHC